MTKSSIVMKRNQCWYCRKQDHILRQCKKFQQKQKLGSFKLWRSISKLYCNPEDLIYKKKEYTMNEILKHIVIAQRRRNLNKIGIQLDQSKIPFIKRVNGVMEDLYLKKKTQKKSENGIILNTALNFSDETY